MAFQANAFQNDAFQVAVAVGGADSWALGPPSALRGAHAVEPEPIPLALPVKVRLPLLRLRLRILPVSVRIGEPIPPAIVEQGDANERPSGKSARGPRPDKPKKAGRSPAPTPSKTPAKPQLRPEPAKIREARKPAPIPLEDYAPFGTVERAQKPVGVSLSPPAIPAKLTEAARPRRQLPPAHLVNSRLAARFEHRQIEAILKADGAANAVDRAISQLLARMWSLLYLGLPPDAVYRQAKAVLQTLPAVVESSIRHKLLGIARWGHKTAANNLVKTVPLEYFRGRLHEAVSEPADRGELVPASRLGRRVYRRLCEGVQSLRHQRAVRERGRRPSRDHVALRAHARPGPAGSLAVRRELTEAEPGLLTLTLGNPSLQVGDPLAPFREPVQAPMTPEEAMELLRQLLFPPPPLDQLERIIFAPIQGKTWAERVGSITTDVDSEAIARQVAASYAQGKTQREIARDLEPHFEGHEGSPKVRARRFARTEGLRVAHEIQMQAHGQLGDLVTGYQLRATLDAFTRPWHAARNGAVYYLDPGPGQKGPRQMPQPPLEPEDPSERPAGTPATAWNCRCHLVPVLRAPDWAGQPEKMEIFNAGGNAIPDPALYSEWFDRADERRRRIAVGSRRYSAVRDASGEAPRWESFIDPETGGLVSVDQLRGESATDRTNRLSRVRALIAERGKLLGQVSRFGFVQ